MRDRLNDLQSAENIRNFERFVQAAPTNEQAERFVREMLEGCARNCPVPVLVRLGECLAACRRTELRGEAETN